MQEIHSPIWTLFTTSYLRLRAEQDTNTMQDDDDIATFSSSSSFSIIQANTNGGPIHRRYGQKLLRIQSYQSWPPSLSQKPQELAEAGFFYIGKGKCLINSWFFLNVSPLAIHLGTGDHVQCFFCDLGLKSWEPSDDPWREHARWSPACAFLLLKMGSQFVEASRSNEQVLGDAPAVSSALDLG